MTKTHTVSFAKQSWFASTMETVDVSASPFFDVATHDAAVATRAPDRLLFVNFELADPVAAVVGDVDLSAHGEAVALDTGTDHVFVGTRDHSV